MKLRDLTLTQRLAAGLGCVVILAILAVVVAYGVLQATARSRARRQLAEAPPGWADSLRGFARLPALGDLALEHDLNGDGSAVAYDPSRRWTGPDVEMAYRALMGLHAGREDSAAWRTVAADTGLDRFVTAARMRRWDALDRVLTATPAAASNILAVPTPSLAAIRNASRALVIRGLVRVARGDRAGARTDLGAAMGLGRQMFAREPTVLGLLVGRAMIVSAAHGWERYAEATRDSVLAARAHAALRWEARWPQGAGGFLALAPDTALALARDTTLALGMRAEALRGVMDTWLLSPRGMLFGVERRQREAIRAFAADRDRDLARIAAAVAATADRINVWHLGELQREASGTGL